MKQCDRLSAPWGWRECTVQGQQVTAACLSDGWKTAHSSSPIEGERQRAPLGRRRGSPVSWARIIFLCTTSFSWKPTPCLAYLFQNLQPDDALSPQFLRPARIMQTALAAESSVTCSQGQSKGLKQVPGADQPNRLLFCCHALMGHAMQTVLFVMWLAAMMKGG